MRTADRYVHRSGADPLACKGGGLREFSSDVTRVTCPDCLGGGSRDATEGTDETVDTLVFVRAPFRPYVGWNSSCNTYSGCVDDDKDRRVWTCDHGHRDPDIAEFCACAMKHELLGDHEQATYIRTTLDIGGGG